MKSGIQPLESRIQLVRNPARCDCSRNTFLLEGVGGGGQGAGDREKRGREVYRRREKRGREAGFPRWREAGEKGKNYATLRNISQSKKCKGAGAKNTGREPGLKGTGSGRFRPPCLPQRGRPLCHNSSCEETQYAIPRVFHPNEHP